MERPPVGKQGDYLSEGRAGTIKGLIEEVRRRSARPDLRRTEQAGENEEEVTALCQRMAF